MALDKEIRYFNEGCSYNAYLSFGCHRGPEGVHRFLVWAPRARAVRVAGDFNGWDGAETPMERLPGGVWLAEAEGVRDGDVYKYEITGPDGRAFLKADPFAAHGETGPATGSKAWDTGGYAWGDGPYMKTLPGRDIRREPVSIYELHLGSWRVPQGARYPWYRRAAEELADYCVQMGYTHVELLPLTEHPYGGSWGYQTTGFFAPTSRYGTPQDFMCFVDTLHQNGIGVILDWTPAHFPRDAHGPAQFDGGPLFERTDPRMAAHPHWGTLIFDYAKPQVKSFLISSALLFLDLYHIDGIRCDAVSSMLYLDYGREAGEFAPNARGGNVCLEAVSFLQDLNAAVHEKFPGRFTVAEEATAFPLVTAPPEEGGLGFDFKWDMGFMHDMLDYMATDPLYRKGSHHKLTFSMMYAFSERFILAFSHDEVVHGKKSMLDKMSGDYGTKFASLRALYGFQYAHPGKKLNFMGSDFGQYIEWDYQKELDWFLLKYPAHDSLHQFVRALNMLYRASPALYEIEDAWEGFQWLNVDDADRSAVVFMRVSRSGEKIICAFNFTPIRYDGFIFGLPGPGTLRALLNSDEARFGGAGADNAGAVETLGKPFLLHPDSAAITLPPMSAVFFGFSEKKA